MAYIKATANMENAQRFIIAVGETVEVCHPIEVHGVNYTGGDQATARNGFQLLYSSLGTLAASARWFCVEYTHNKSGRQIIVFEEELTGDESFLVMDAIEVHDHGSVITGGPAYATYFTEPEGQEEGG